MNLNFTLTFTVLQVLVFVIAVFVFIFAFKTRKLLKSRKRIAELENEMLICHREILELQQLSQQNNNKLGAVEQKEFKVFSMRR